MAIAKEQKMSRKEQILQVLVRMLEDNLGERITTAKLAAEVGVTEAALYRHFPSKAKMYEGLVEFIEETVFSRISRIKQDDGSSLEKLQRILTLVLAFAEKNQGMCRILAGDALAGENRKVRARAEQFFQRLETELKQVIRDAEVREGTQRRLTPAAGANLLLVNVEGRIHQFVRSEFQIKPTAHWASHWPMLANGLFQ
jgi:TetR/AcrR family transcriptional regulator